MSAPVLTVFIGTFNRLSTLEKTVESYSRMTTPHELVIVDNGTDDPECLDLLWHLKKRVKRVYHLPGANDMVEATESFNVAIRDQYDNGSGAKWFAVSEADVCFDETDPEAFDVYIDLAKASGQSVGPHLQVDAGIPACYPLRSRVLACESRLLYRDSMQWHDRIPYSSHPIDTTFHLFPRTRRFERLKFSTLRVGPPWTARHLDWYLDIEHPTRENEVYIPGLRPVGSWGKAWLRTYWQDFQRDPEMAFRQLLAAQRVEVDLNNNAFMLAWAYQYGHGCGLDIDRSMKALHDAIPYPHSHYWPRQESWLKMIYEDDFGDLGWGVAGPGVEPGSRPYEDRDVPFVQPAPKTIA